MWTFKKIIALYFAYNIIKLYSFDVLANEPEEIKKTCFNIYNTGHEINIHDAIGLGCKNLVKSFLDNGFDPNFSDRYGRSLLIAAMSGGKHHIDIIKLLLEYGANPNLVEVGDAANTPFARAIFHGNIETVKLMLAYQAEVNKLNIHSMSPLYIAAMSGHTKIVKILLESGSEPNGSGGLNPILAVGNMAILELLISHGVDFRSVGVDGNNALMGASMFGNSDVVNFLYKAGLDVNSVDNKNYTPLMYAILGNKYDNVVTLVLLGADVKMKNELGQNSLEIAESRNSDKIADYLKSLDN